MELLPISAYSEWDLHRLWLGVTWELKKNREDSLYGKNMDESLEVYGIIIIFARK